MATNVAAEVASHKASEPSVTRRGSGALPQATGVSLNEALAVRIILAFTALLYAPTLRFGFAYDDQLVIVANPLVRAWRFVPDYFTHHVWQNINPLAPSNYGYRPLDLLWFRINDALFGLRPMGWHASTIALHVFAVWLAYLLARQISGKARVAAFTALLFAVHPMRHEVVSWISSTSESLWSVLFLLAFLAYLKSRGGLRWMMLSCGLYAAALLAKETAIVLPAVVFAHAVIYGKDAESSAEPLRRRFWAALKSAAIYAPVVLAYIGARVAVLGAFSDTHSGVTLKEFVLTLPSVLLFYARQWFLPIRFAATYDLVIRPRLDMVHVLLPAMGIIIIAALPWFWRNTLGRREVMFASAWVALLLLPALDLFVLPVIDLVHDRYFYLPGWGACLLLGLTMEKLAEAGPSAAVPRKWLLATLAVTALLSCETLNATSYWTNDYRLFEHAYKVVPDSPIARNNYADELVSAGKYSEAMPIVQQAVVDHPNDSLPNFLLGRVFYYQGQFSSAEQYLRKAQELEPREAEPYLYLGLTYFRMNRFSDAESSMRRALSAQPDPPLLPSLHFSLATVLTAEGKCDEGGAEFRKALDLQPNLPHAQDQINNCGKPKIPN